MDGTNMKHGSAGVNLIGYASANFSLGITVRHVATALACRGVPFKVFDIPQGRTIQGIDRSLEAESVHRPEDLPHTINIFCVAIGSLPGLLSDGFFEQFRKPDRLNAGLIFWELPVMPEHWAEALQVFDVILCSSWFIRELIANQVPKLLPIYMPYPLMMPVVPARNREYFGIGCNRFCFYFSFDPFSGLDRKNPSAVLEAFSRAFADRGDVQLVIKLNADSAATERVSPVVSSFLANARQKKNVAIITESLGYVDALSLMNVCDCFVSLHRSEGLGMGPLEAMLLGKPVIATAWSGNMSYMSPSTACLVPYDLVEPGDVHPDYYRREYLPRRTVWAEPSIEGAAFWMRRLVDDDRFREELAANGKRHADAYLSAAEECAFVDDLFALRGLLSMGRSTNRSFSELRSSVLRLQRRNSAVRIQRIREILDRHVLWRFKRS